MLEAEINGYLRATLIGAGCNKGTLTCEYKMGRFSVLIVNGEKDGGGSVAIWELDNDFRNKVVAFFKQGTAGKLRIQIDLSNESFKYTVGSSGTTGTGPAGAVAPLSVYPYGHALAERIAGMLDQGRGLGYNHADYCGNGLKKRGDTYVYGSIWDGVLEPELTFTQREKFIQWLSAQSDRSMGGDAGGDQQITRRRIARWLKDPSER